MRYLRGEVYVLPAPSPPQPAVVWVHTAGFGAYLVPELEQNTTFNVSGAQGSAFRVSRLSGINGFSATIAYLSGPGPGGVSTVTWGPMTAGWIDLAVADRATGYMVVTARGS